MDVCVWCLCVTQRARSEREKKGEVVSEGWALVQYINAGS